MRPQGRRAFWTRLDLGLPRVDADDLAQRLGQPWLVDLGHELRPSFLAPPGVPVERTVTVPPDGRLAASYGFAGAAAEPLRFVATFTPEGEDSARVLAEETLEPDADGWQELQADLSALAGRTGLLRLETLRAEEVGEEAYDLGQGAPVWASPELRTVRDGDGAPKPPNLLLVSLDTLRADHLSLYGYERETAPHLTRWARENAVTFRNTVAPAGWTLPSHTTLFTGLNTLTHGVNYAETVPGSLEMLAETLRRAGYHTVAYTGGSYLHPRYGLAQGFDRFRYWPISPGPDGQGEDLEGQVPRLLEEVGRLPEPFFLFFHTYEIHTPYHRRSPYFERFAREAGADPNRSGRMMAPTWQVTGPEDGFVKRQRLERTAPGGSEVLTAEDQPWIDAVYDSGIAFADEYLGRLLEALEDSGAADRTVTVVTSDHGEALGDNGDAEHGLIHDYNLMVPLILSVPGRTAGETYEPQVRLEDVTPTVLDLLGVPVPGDLDGVSLTPVLDGRQAPVPREAWSYSANRNWGVSLRVANRLKLHYRDVAFAPAHGERQLFDLTVDPGETNDLAAEHPQTGVMTERVVERLSRRLQGLRVTFENRSEAPLAGRLEGRMIKKYLVKGIDLPAPGVRWIQRGEIGFEVPAGGVAPLVFERAHDWKAFRLQVDAGEAWPALDRRVTPEHVEKQGGELVLTPSPAGWRPARRGDANAPARLVVAWETESDRSSVAPEDLDPELREQLRALGYLD